MRSPPYRRECALLGPDGHATRRAVGVGLLDLDAADVDQLERVRAPLLVGEVALVLAVARRQVQERTGLVARLAVALARLAQLGGDHEHRLLAIGGDAEE